MKIKRTVWLNHNHCTGCHLCQLICSYTKTGKFDLEKARISIIERDEPGFIPMICRNCEEPPCADACPAGAITKKDKHVILNEEQCIGCNMCVMVCPFNAIGQGNHKNYNCDHCCGKEKCAEICEHGAITFNDSAKELKKKRQQAMERALKD